jgi:uncharacterized membrane protein YqiK
MSTENIENLKKIAAIIFVVIILIIVIVWFLSLWITSEKLEIIDIKNKYKLSDDYKIITLKNGTKATMHISDGDIKIGNIVKIYNSTFFGFTSDKQNSDENSVNSNGYNANNTSLISMIRSFLQYCLVIICCVCIYIIYVTERS